MQKSAKNTGLALKKTITLIVGGPIFVVGLILIPLPGPGILIAFVGIYILSKGFSFVDNYYIKLKKVLLDIYRNSKSKYDDFLVRHDLE